MNSYERNKNGGFLYMRKPATLSWRLDPDESLSDWKISIVSSPELEGSPTPYFDRFQSSNIGFENQLNQTIRKDKIAATKIYFVHRAKLAVGPRRSEFFVNLFKRIKNSENIKEQRNPPDYHGRLQGNAHSTMIELIPTAASCFSVMLDYIYSSEGTPLRITTQSAVALRQLASSFGVREMFRETTQFIKTDLNTETSTTYLLEANKFQNKKIQQTAIGIVASNFLSMKITALICIPPNLMKDITKSIALTENDMERYSKKIASYCRCREDDLTLLDVDAYSSARILTTVGASESLYFLHLLFRLRNKDELNLSLETMNLYKLCLIQVPKVLVSLLGPKSITKDGHKSILLRQKNELEYYDSLPIELKVYLLERSFESSNSPVPEIFSTPSLSQIKAKKEAYKLKNEVKCLKMSYDKKVDYFQRMLDTKVEELRRATHQAAIE